MLLMIDNYDSFTYNLVQYLGELGADVARPSQRRDHASSRSRRGSRRRSSSRPARARRTKPASRVPLIRALRRQDPDPRRVPRPPGDRAGVRRAHRARAARDARQALADRARRPRRVRRAADAAHGDALSFARDRARRRLPACLEVTATADDGEIMGVRHRELAVEGVQFHPEAILTEHGHALLANFLDRADTDPGRSRDAHHAAGSAAAHDRAPRDLPRRDAVADAAGS